MRCNALVQLGGSPGVLLLCWVLLLCIVAQVLLVAVCLVEETSSCWVCAFTGGRRFTRAAPSEGAQPVGPILRLSCESFARLRVSCLFVWL